MNHHKTDKLNKVNKFGFAFYDFSNSGYVMIFQTFLFPLLIASVISDTSLKPGEIWGWAVTTSVVIAVILAPLIGRVADQRNKSIPFAILVTGVGILSFIAPIFISNKILLLLMVFIVFNAMFELTQSLYNAFLRDIANSHRAINKLSTFAWGFGYLGGVLFALVYLALVLC